MGLEHSRSPRAKTSIRAKTSVKNETASLNISTDRAAHKHVFGPNEERPLPSSANVQSHLTSSFADDGADGGMTVGL